MISHDWTQGNTARAASKFLLSIAFMASVLTVGLESAAPAANLSTVTEAATFPIAVESLGLSTLTVNLQKVGDLVIFQSHFHTQSITVTGVTSPKTGAWQLAQRYVDTKNGAITEEIWWAVATSTGSTTITATYSASVAALSPELISDSFTSSVPSTWSFVSGGGAAASSTTAIAFPSVTSGAAANQVYWGYAQSTQTASRGSTPGFTYTPTASGNLITFNDALSSNTAYAPTASESPISNNSSIAAIFAATPT